MLNDDRLFPVESSARAVARNLYQAVRDQPILSPHGHTHAAWFAENQPFPDPSALLLQPDHYIFRMLYSQGISLASLGIPQRNGKQNADPLEAWRIFAQNYYLFRGTPTRLWFDSVLQDVFGLDERLQKDNADEYYRHIAALLGKPEFLPRALYERFRIAVLATTDAATDTLEHHRAIRSSEWAGQIIPTFRPDAVVDPQNSSFLANLKLLAELTNEDIWTWDGYLTALRKRRAYFKANGATASDHGHPTAATANLSRFEAEGLFSRVLEAEVSPVDAELFRAQMLTEMAAMSIEDGLTMQLHPGSFRNHNPEIYAKYGPDKGADIPQPTNYVHALSPLLSRFGNERGFALVLFTLDESTYSRELAPLAGHYPSVYLGPSWWFHDSPEGMLRFRERVTETAGFYNTVGFNDDTRAFLSIPARHDVARRMDAVFLARLVSEHRLDESEAYEVMQELTTNLVRKVYKLGRLNAETKPTGLSPRETI